MNYRHNKKPWNRGGGGGYDMGQDNGPTGQKKNFNNSNHNKNRHNKNNRIRNGNGNNREGHNYFAYTPPPNLDNSDNR